MKRFCPMIFLYISVVLVGFMDSQSKYSDGSEKEPAVTRFADWSKWQKLYKSCNSEKNRYNSPVNISSSEAEKSSTQTLMVFSEKPDEDIYFFSTYYEAGNMQMESFNVKLSTDDTYREATHVSGLESPQHRFFKSALILFRPQNDSHREPLDPQQHFHSIDGIEYPMEIMFHFETPTLTEKTQVHVMVELSKEENPAWIPILNAFEGLKKKTMDGYCSRKEWIREAKENLEEKRAIYIAAQKVEKNYTKEQTYEIKIYELTALLEILKDAKNESLNNLTRQYSNALTEKLKCKEKSNDVGARIKNLTGEIATLAGAQSKGDASEKRKRKAVLDELKQMLETLNEKNRRLLTTCIEEASQKVYKYERELQRQNELLRRSRVGSGPTAIFSSVQDIANILDEMKKKFAELKHALREYQDAQKEVEKLLSIPERAATIKDPFQISWLFPPVGGYFSYKGSSPIPPCERVPYVVVLETPITISSEQLQEFQEFPSFTDPSSEQLIKQICHLRENEHNDDSAGIFDALSKMQKLPSQVPRNVPLGKRKVSYNPKNIQFIDDDGLHMKSSTRAKLKGVKNHSATKVSIKILPFLLCNFIVIFFS